MSKLKLEVGKAYKTRGGYKAIIIEKAEDNKDPFFAVAIKGIFDSEGWEVEYVTLDGCKYSDGSKSDCDLIGEWVEPLEFDWNCLPEWCDKAIEMDRNGEWFCYASKPAKARVNYWDPVNDIACEFIPPEYAPKNFTGSWEDSLFVNPKYQEE